MNLLARTPLSALDVVPMRAGGSAADALREALAYGRDLDRLGFHRMWLAEHHNLSGVASSATAVLVGQIAAATRRLRVGAGGIMLPNHAPLVVAENFGTLETLFPGRIDLGLGRAPGADGATMRALRRSAGDGGGFPDQVADIQRLLGPDMPGQRVRAVPGVGTGVPVWILGSGTFGAALAAERGLPFAFAAHIAPQALHEAAHVYRSTFQPSAVGARPYLMVCLPLVAADSDEKAQFLATTMFQRSLALVRGEGLTMLPPVADMGPHWRPDEEEAVRSMLAAAIVGGPATVARGLEQVLSTTGVDELMFSSNFYHAADRLRSAEIVAQLRGETLKTPLALDA
ncbi:LLM class flavin-dependent oxidoreductase [Massilia orientalis]|jgi:luciferase family oxidoreductase group 1|uniref:LLM class flavin-dependent oxidoreductase n=1 Tax=Massilia orientalis TaxID=3050128 RepID=A0ACC7M6C8_9BURK|nr:LLM class flavin-dependent oxidoreductase [Massilia sp. YIM B02787]